MCVWGCSFKVFQKPFSLMLKRKSMWYVNGAPRTFKVLKNRSDGTESFLQLSHHKHFSKNFDTSAPEHLLSTEMVCTKTITGTQRTFFLCTTARIRGWSADFPSVHFWGIPSQDNEDICQGIIPFRWKDNTKMDASLLKFQTENEQQHFKQYWEVLLLGFKLMISTGLCVAGPCGLRIRCT